MDMIGLLLAAAVAGAPPVPEATGWQYSVTHDAMRGTSRRIACIASEENVAPASPYSPQKLMLCISNQKPGDLGQVGVVFSKKGQFAIPNGVAMKIDAGSVERYPVYPQGTDFSVLRIWAQYSSTPNLEAVIQASTKIMAEASLFEVGPVQVTFKTAGYKPWTSDSDN